VDFDVVVIGSLNRDISVLAPRLPVPGESVTGREHFFGPGGKGANQAVAAARLGARVAMVGRVGADDYGAALVAGLEKERIDVSAIVVDEAAPTGIAVITIDDGAENTIVVSPGANMRLTSDDVQHSVDVIAAAPVVLVQLEVPMEAVLAAAEAATGVFCLNPAPARPLPLALLDRIDLLVPNRSELAILADSTEATDVSEAIATARGLGHRGATVVTLGGDGAVIVDGDRATEVSSPDVAAVDPTGAGDAFCGALASQLSKGRSLGEAVEWAVAAGALAVTRRGAQDAMPTLEEVEALVSGDSLR
jgi:ribokinase